MSRPNITVEKDGSLPQLLIHYRRVKRSNACICPVHPLPYYVDDLRRSLCYTALEKQFDDLYHRIRLLSLNSNPNKLMKRIGTFLAVAAFFLTGCASTKPIKPVDTSTVSYKSEEVSRQEISNSSIAILPVLAGQGYEGFRRTTGTALTKAFQQEFPQADILSFRKTLNKLNDAGLSQDYSEMMSGYERTGVLDQETLSKLGEAVGSPYLLYSKVGVSQSTESQLVGGEYMSESNVSEISVYAQLWDTEAGDVVWEGNGGGAGLEESAGTNQLIRIASDGIAMRVAKSANNVPSPATAEDLHQQAQQQKSTNFAMVYWGAYLGAAMIIPIIFLI